MRHVISLLVFVCLSGLCASQTVYFLVADPDGEQSDSYVLPLTDPNDIAHARDLIDGITTDDPLVVAHIGCGWDGINRDYLSPSRQQWRWHVTEFDGFGSLSGEILDGNPTMVNNDCGWWVANTGGVIGFWDYTVVAELGEYPRHWECNFSGDDQVNLADFVELALQWMRMDCAEPDWCLARDLNRDGAVDLYELTRCSDAWLSEYAGAPLWFEAWDYPNQCYGDVNQDGFVTAMDLGALSQAIQFSGGTDCGDMGYSAVYDIDHDCDVDMDDLEIVQNLLSSHSYPFIPPGDCPATP